MVRDALKKLGFTDDAKEIKKMYEDTYAYSLDMRSIYGTRKIRLFIQGSYANNTNVRTQSDVDIAVVQEDVFKTEYRTISSGMPQCDKDYGFGEIVEYLYKHKEKFGLYKEVNGIKALCPALQDVTNYKNFVNKLYEFYEYDI